MKKKEEKRKRGKGEKGKIMSGGLGGGEGKEDCIYYILHSTHGRLEGGGLRLC